MSASSKRFSRRDALKLAAATGAASVIPLRADAERSEGEFQTFVPTDKKLDPKWVQKLFERGEPSKWSGDSLRYIGMPIGGLCCGQVYLGGDGQLWHWDICTSPTGWDMSGLSGGKHYANPIEPHQPIKCGVSFTIGRSDEGTPLSKDGEWDITFENNYPVGIVTYRSNAHPVEVKLEASSPFIPMATADSALPLIHLEYTFKNVSAKPMVVNPSLLVESPVGKFTNRKSKLEFANSTGAEAGWNFTEIRSLEGQAPEFVSVKPPNVFEDFEGSNYGAWKVEGTALGDRPMRVSELPPRYLAANPVGKSFVNTHQSRAGEESVEADLHLGKLTSPTFTISRPYMNFRIGGGNHPGRTCINVIVDGKVVATSTGRNSLTLRKDSFDLRSFLGKTAFIEIVDNEKGGWGHVSIDRIEFADAPDIDELPLSQLQDFGSFAAGVSGGSKPFIETPNNEMLHLGCSISLNPGESKAIAFVVSWFFPNYGKPTDSFAEITDISKLKKHYAKRFKSALDVVRYFAKNEKRLTDATKTWASTWYDSTLPFWFLERAIVPIDCLQTATSHWFDSGRFYGWEGVYCCPGTCQHVWNYAQGAARLFPELERSAREKADYGISWQPDGTIWYRGESGRHMAHDGQAGTILRTYREHTMTADGAFLKRNWPKIKKSIERLIKDDPNRDGLWEGEQYNTLDSSWFGKISWISSLYIAALRSGVEMAKEMGDDAFANDLLGIVERGAKAIVKETFNGEYFAMIRDPNHPRAPGSGPGCHIDQVFGDSFLHMVGLPPNLPQKETVSGLRSIWKYNYAPDAGGYMQSMQSVIKGGRWYAMPGEPGLLMTTFPNGGARDSKGEGNPDWMVGYFNECMNGFEYQAAAHMIAESLVTEGMAIVHSLHERYSGGKRNPYNEVECSDHYSRSMASYGAFLTACGFAYHGPKGEISFAPKIPGARFRGAFTAAEGWGSYEQNRKAPKFEAKLELKYGKLRLTKLGLSPHMQVIAAEVKLGSKKIDAEWNGMDVVFKKPLMMKAGDTLIVSLSSLAESSRAS